MGHLQEIGGGNSESILRAYLIPFDVDDKREPSEGD
jgi:hypothetical protein